jgi:hypothetical protein
MVTFGRFRLNIFVLLSYTWHFSVIVAGGLVASNNAFDIAQLNPLTMKTQRWITSVFRRQQWKYWTRFHEYKKRAFLSIAAVLNTIRINTMSLGLHVKFQIFLSNFNQIWIFSTYLNRSLQYYT